MNSMLHTTEGAAQGEVQHKDSQGEANSGGSPMKEIRQLLVQMEQAGDLEHAGKLRQLMAKVQTGRLNLAFCGHFSAGKSSLINKLCGHQLLPSSPIPTSANIVSIASGEPGARVVYRAEESATGSVEAGRTERVALDDLAEHCRNGEAIETVEITYPIPLLGDMAALLDTPGVDSTDDAHQLATESALHLADAVFYTMDYNHVLSEVNLAFAKKMVEWGKPLYLIVNMIDKHREHEVTLEAYKAGVHESFASWGVKPDGIVYTSVKVPEHPANEWSTLLWLLSELIARKDSLIVQSLEQSARALAKQHADKLAEAAEPEKEALRARLAEDEGVEAAQQQAVELQAELKRIDALPQTIVNDVRKEVTALLDNANVTPAVTRDLAHTYLESRRPGFKVGWLGSAAKTTAERERRLAALHQDFASQVHTQVERHVQQLLKAKLSGLGLATERVAEAAEGVTFEVTPEWLAAAVNEAAVFGNEYTMTYSKHVAAELKAAYRRLALDVADALAAELAAALAPSREALAAQLAALEQRLSALRELERREQAERAYRDALLAALPASARAALPAPERAPGRDAAAGEAAAAASAAAPAASAALAALAERAGAGARGAAGGGEAAAASGLRAAGGHRARLRSTSERLAAAAGELEDVAALQSIRRSLLEKAERLAGNRFTIALFGAFSAGKSSFANALIGERVLPVSPNPTTAAINKIMPPEPEAGWPHGTAKVRVKSADKLTADVLYSLEMLGERVESLDQALAAIDGLKPERIPGKGKPHFAFLRAVKLGWSAMSASLGQELRITVDEFGSYAADESKSCFVELIELYYTNPLTEQGVVLVDTPGADSINARHTGVAFEFIKNADAILFVTYYNHAFSHADQQFLLQLGRVKDSFELDKMFFIVNAADLASSSEELDGVVKHVESNLLHHGIRHPRIYPLSSYYALEGKLAGDEAATDLSGITRFEQEFVRFTFEELTDMAVQAGDADLRRASQTLQSWLDSASSDAADRAKQAEALRRSLAAASSRLQETTSDREVKELSKEIEELLYYVKQRTAYRFGELYQLAFHPSLFREDPREPKAVLMSAWEDLRRMISFDLSQEILATTLRIENAINKLAKETAAQWTDSIRKELSSFDSPGFESFKLNTPELTGTLEADDVNAKWLSGFFKNTKQFYEGEGRAQLRRELESRLNTPMARFAQQQAEQLELAYADQLRSVLTELSAQWQQAMREHAEGLLEALEMKLDLAALQAKQSRLDAYRQQS
ncbi:dynamin family protein [Paenibacillus sp. YYML68]|uniref:dynamin family protein n=1 Tax=Paenibacillus sp. YYML68 TaxID=2909250 RepID=UPI00249239C5|nr:dynamin family protein [Paenibacillus sp. YYML68]